MNKLTTAKRVAVVAALVEGNSVRSTARMTNVSKPTILKLLADLGTACSAFHNATVRNIRAQRVQCDEIWQFVGAKQKNVTPQQRAQGWGDLWTWTALDSDSKLIVSWFVGQRDPHSAWWFMRDLASRLITRVQLTTDGLNAYLPAVERAFEGEIDYGQLVKMYGAQDREKVVRYSPARFVSARREVITGSPDMKHVSTSYVDRQNLSMRMGMRRFTRLTNAFSKKAENHAHAIALYFVHYNFAKIHGSLRVTPMAAGVADHAWSLEELVMLFDKKTDVAA
ncbi:MAG TPA: IS1 family transposase [Vicinamibacterales bacterium]|nr:IS1 family transposase [Vicinamibacterales bacterium]